MYAVMCDPSSYSCRSLFSGHGAGDDEVADDWLQAQQVDVERDTTTLKPS